MAQAAAQLFDRQHSLIHCSPYAYGVISLAQNEFFADRYGAIVKSGSQTLGQQYLTTFSMPTDRG